jgi:hypothetical protein
MLVYRDMTFCSAHCANEKCFRNRCDIPTKTDLPICFANFIFTCEKYMKLPTKTELIDLLKANSAVEVKFTKKSDGSTRVMLCTLNKEVLAQAGKLKDAPLTERKHPENLVYAFDLEADAWRSFDINSVFAVNVN